MRLFLVSILCLQPLWSETDYYPKIREQLLAAEKECAKIAKLDDRNYHLANIARLFARAGYLEDAIRIVEVVPSDFNFLLLAKAQALYGETSQAHTTLRRILGPVDRANFSASVAHLLWQTGNRKEAERILLLADDSIPTIADGKKREQIRNEVKAQREYMQGEPPISLSPIPQPKPPQQPARLRDDFPYSVDGFRPLNPTKAEKDRVEGASFLTALYTLIAAQKWKDAMEHAALAETDEQKLLGLASVAHLMVQAGRLDLAEQVIANLPETNPDTILAKAEAWSYLGAAMAKSAWKDKAGTLFNRSERLARNISLPALTKGKLFVLSELALNRRQALEIEESKQTFKDCLELVKQIAPDPKPVPGRPRPARVRQELLNRILSVQLRADDSEGAKQTENTWLLLEPTGAHEAISNIWFHWNKYEEAFRVTNQITKLTDRLEHVQWLLNQLLTLAGAPNN